MPYPSGSNPPPSSANLYMQVVKLELEALGFQVDFATVEVIKST